MLEILAKPIVGMAEIGTRSKQAIGDVHSISEAIHANFGDWAQPIIDTADLGEAHPDDGTRPYRERAPALSPSQLRPCSCGNCTGFSLTATMILCPACGNKRCPRASDHRFACTGSNESGQFGSIYGESFARCELSNSSDNRHVSFHCSDCCIEQQNADHARIERQAREFCEIDVSEAMGGSRVPLETALNEIRSMREELAILRREREP